MNVDFRKYFPVGASFFGGILAVFLLGGLVRPMQNDNAHLIGILTAKGGVATHAGHIPMGSALFGSYTIMLTAKVTPPVKGDIKVELTGPAPLSYQVASRYPPTVPLLNRFHPWYRFENNIVKGVVPGDDFVLVVKTGDPTVPGQYNLTLTNVKTNQVYLTMPINFEPREEPMAQTGSEAPCH